MHWWTAGNQVLVLSSTIWWQWKPPHIVTLRFGCSSCRSFMDVINQLTRRGIWLIYSSFVHLLWINYLFMFLINVSPSAEKIWSFSQTSSCDMFKKKGYFGFQACNLKCLFRGCLFMLIKSKYINIICLVFQSESVKIILYNASLGCFSTDAIQYSLYYTQMWCFDPASVYFSCYCWIVCTNCQVITNWSFIRILGFTFKSTLLHLFVMYIDFLQLSLFNTCLTVWMSCCLVGIRQKVWFCL